METMTDVLIDKRSDVYREGDLWVFRASSLGTCTRSLVLSALGVDGNHTKPANIQRGMDEGTAAEPIILAAARKHGWRPIRQPGGRKIPGENYNWRDDMGQYEQEIRVGTCAVVRCHPDDIMCKFRAATDKYPEPTGDDELWARRVVEAKALRDPPKTAAGVAGLFGGGYGWQFAVEMHATKLPMLLLVGAKRDDGTVGAGDVTPYWVDEPMHSLGAIKARVLRIVKIIERVQNEGMEALVDCDVRAFPCPYFADWHDGQEVHAKGAGAGAGAEVDLPTLEITKKADREALGKLLNALDKAKSDVNVANSAVKRLKAEINDLMERNGGTVGENNGDGWLVPSAYSPHLWKVTRVVAEVGPSAGHTRNYIDYRLVKVDNANEGTDES